VLWLLHAPRTQWGVFSARHVAHLIAEHSLRKYKKCRSLSGPVGYNHPELRSHQIKVSAIPSSGNKDETALDRSIVTQNAAPCTCQTRGTAAGPAAA
jgi:hypothetical protein